MKYEQAIKAFEMASYTTTCPMKKHLYETAIEAMEKQVPKKPKLSGGDVFKKCPVCNTPFWDWDYCKVCGQRIDKIDRGF